MRETWRMQRKEHGYSLVEVLVAVALLGVVTMTIMTLFTLGSRNVYSGKQMTTAIAIGTQVLEDLTPLNKSMLYKDSFLIADTAIGGTVTIPTPLSTTYTNARIRSTNATLITSPPGDIATENTTAGAPQYLSKWRSMVTSKLGQGSVTLILQPAEDPTNDPPQFATSRLLRVRVLVRWNEGRRQREVVLDSVRSF